MTESESFLDGKVSLHSGDCLDVMATLESASVDAVCCDPPYGLGFMGKAWDHGVPGVAYWKAALRVLKPGGHLAAFSGTRTYHRMTCAIEDAGFEIRDMISWLYGSGFPKSLDVSKAIDKMHGAEREVVSQGAPVKRMIPGADQHKEGWEKSNGRVYVPGETAPATAAAKLWDGFGTALKPACEPIVLARKPLIGTVAENVLKHGTGALNIDGCRVPSGPDHAAKCASVVGLASPTVDKVYAAGLTHAREDSYSLLGRWPANIVHDGSEEVLGEFPSTDIVNGRPNCAGKAYSADGRQILGEAGPQVYNGGYLDSGSAARFFYTAKADADDRLGSKHPTVKPLDLMQWLVRLVTPPGGVVLDPFAGTGTTGEAAWREGFRAILIEREPEYQNDIRRRMAHALAGPEERKRTIAKIKYGDHVPTGSDLFSRAAE